MSHSEQARIFMEKRRSPRLEVFLPVEYKVSRILPKAQVLSKDIGQGGIGLLLKRKIETGTVLAMVLHVPGGEGKLSLKGEVVRCHPEQGSPEKGYGWRAGLKFLSIESKASAILGQIIQLYSLQEGSGKKRGSQKPTRRKKP